MMSCSISASGQTVTAVLFIRGLQYNRQFWQTHDEAMVRGLKTDLENPQGASIQIIYIATQTTIIATDVARS